MRQSYAVLFFLLSLSACSDQYKDYAVEEPVQPAPSAPGAAAPSESGKESQKFPSDYGAKLSARKIHYEGTLSLETAEPANALAQAAEKVKNLGGYSELETKDTVVLHVPVAKFMDVFEEVQGLGKVLKKSLTGSDITEAYSDTALRKQLIQASLKKLEQLLALAKSVSERLALLKEIGELRGRLEEAEALLAMLSHKSQYSKLTVSVVEPVRAIASLKPRPIGVFAWIDGLSPEQALGKSRGRKFELNVPADYVLVPSDRYWLAESASQATFSATRLKNEPRGDAAFWVETLKERLKGRYEVAKTFSQGKFQVIRLTDPAGEGYRYDVGVLTEGDTLVIAEAVYPNAADEQRFGPKVFAALDSYDGKGL